MASIVLHIYNYINLLWSNQYFMEVSDRGNPAKFQSWIAYYIFNELEDHAKQRLCLHGVSVAKCTVKYSDGIGVTPIEYQLLGSWTLKYRFGHPDGHYWDFYMGYEYPYGNVHAADRTIRYRNCSPQWLSGLRLNKKSFFPSYGDFLANWDIHVFENWLIVSLYDGYSVPSHCSY